MSDAKVITQIMQDMRQHSSGESVLRQQLSDRISVLEQEILAWNNECLKDDKRIRDLKLRVHELETALKTIAAQDSNSAYAIDRDACAQLARELLTQGGVYEIQQAT